MYGIYQKRSVYLGVDTLKSMSVIEKMIGRPAIPMFRKYDGELCDLRPKRLSESWCRYYDAILVSYFPVGTYGEAEMYAHETIQSVSQQLCEACQRCGVGIDIISENRGVIFFKIIE